MCEERTILLSVHEGCWEKTNLSLWLESSFSFSENRSPFRHLSGYNPQFYNILECSLAVERGATLLNG
jgi:hypothetical protein